MADSKTAGFTRNLILSCTALLVFLLFTAAVKVVDVQPVGFEGSPIGLATINTAFNSMFPQDNVFYSITEYLGYFALGFAGAVGLVSLVDLIQSRGLLKMKRHLLVTCLFYGVVLGFYVLFELYVVNFRPIEAEASYPSSHTMLALCIFSSAMSLSHYSRNGRSLSVVIGGVLSILMVVMVIGRLLCGVHWLTDIIGAVLLSLALISFYRTFLKAYC